MQKKWDNQEEIKQALLRGEITSQEAFELVTRRKVKPWETKEWEEIRAARIGSACTQCGSEEGPMVLQHLWQPMELRAILNLMHEKYTVEYEKAHPRPEMPPEPEPVERQGCPRCKSTNIRWVKSFSYWQCNARKCGRIKFEPVTVWALSPEQKAAMAEARRVAMEAWRQGYRAAMDEPVRRDAVLLSIEQHQRYLSCKDTTTFCKRCAFLWDMKDLKLCPVCKQEWVKRFLPACAACLAVR